MKKQISVVFVLLIVLQLSVRAEDKSGKAKTNFLFIIVDDLRTQLGCYGHSETLSPNIDELASEAVLFKNAYCNVPVCGASRASLLTGLRPLPNRFTNFASAAEKEAPGMIDIPGYLKQNGYQTISNGKVYHDEKDNANSWTEIYRPIDFRDYRMPENIALMKEKGMAAAWEVSPMPDDSLQGGKIALKVIEDLRKLKKSGEPFFLTAGFTKPHLPFIAPQKYWDMYRHEDIQLAKNPFVPEKCPKEALHNWGELRKQYTGIPQAGPVSDEIARTLIHGYYACVSYTDAMIGRIMEELKRLDLDKNTVVVLCGDHGWQLGEHSLWCKHCNFDTSLHAPLIIKAPGCVAGYKSESLVEYVDLFPTFCEYAGLSIPNHLPGMSMKRILIDPSATWKQAVYARFKRGESVKTKDFLYTEFMAKGERVSHMLYDHKKDKNENYNVADEAEYKKVVEEMQQLLKEGL